MEYTKNKELNLKHSIFMWTLLCLAITAFFAAWFFTGRHSRKDSVVLSEGVYLLGDITVDTNKNEISFLAKVKKNEGRVSFLIYLTGYKWLEDESAVVSSANLSDLQEAAALIDWNLWDKLWRRTAKEGKMERDMFFSVYLVHNEKEIPAADLLLTKDPLGLGDFIFLGSPYFDQFVLGSGQSVNCAQCPLFPIEEKILRDFFIRESGESGYDLNRSVFPHKGENVIVIIRADG